MPLIVEHQECACVFDPTVHGVPLTPGPGAVTVLYNFRPVWRVGIDIHICPIPTAAGPPHGAGVVAVGALRTMAGGSFIARKGDSVVEALGGPTTIVPGAMA